ncbi:MAG: prepilin-type N-terminal cleavage/methylation domain-containing protein [Verrucomicrobiota bacterium]
MLQRNKQNQSGFTLVEIMIVVSLVALLSAITVPNLSRARKRSQAARILADLRQIDSAINQYAIDNGLASGDTLTFSKLKLYLKTGSALYSTGASPLTVSYGDAFQVDSPISTPVGTGTAMRDVIPNDFWSPYVLID